MQAHKNEENLENDVRLEEDGYFLLILRDIVLA